MRGKPPASDVGSRADRITPACAGKTPACTRRNCRRQDHPRVCGENRAVSRFSISLKGSPPRVRGKQFPKKYKTVAEGITPACAGKTNFIYILGSFAKDHPRVCGENCVRRLLRRAPAGSPPRVRGKLLEADFIDASQGITPACAGKTA